MNKLLPLIIILFLTSSAFAKEVTLSWDASPTAGVTGYNVYYDCDDENAPFDGIEADLPSPIDAGDVLTYTVTGLPDELGCYFTTTAYNEILESTYSNIVYSQGFAPPEPPSGLTGITTVEAVDIPTTPFPLP